jgi:5-methylcytosine-specific restriction endonuclease McrA
MRDKMRCQYCGSRGNAFDLTLDHIVPRSRGGSSTPENLCAACMACNQRKGDRTPDEARMPLLATPSALRYGLERAVLNHYSLTRPEWRPFLFLDEEERIA